MFSMNTTDRLLGTTHEHMLSKASYTSFTQNGKLRFSSCFLEIKTSCIVVNKFPPCFTKTDQKYKVYFFDLRKCYNLPKAKQ